MVEMNMAVLIGKISRANSQTMCSCGFVDPERGFADKHLKQQACDLKRPATAAIETEHVERVI